MRIHTIVIVFGAAALAAAAAVLLRQEPPAGISAPAPAPSTAAAPARRSALPSFTPLHDPLIDLAGRFDAVRSSPEAARRYHEARHALVEQGPDRIPELSKVLSEDADLAVRLMALSVIQGIGGPAGLEALDRAHRNRAMDETLRVAAAESVATIEGADPEPVLLRILNEGPGRDVAASELGRRRSAAAVPPLGAILADPRDLSLACHAADALGRIGGPEARAALERRLSETDTPVLLDSINRALSILKESP